MPPLESLSNPAIGCYFFVPRDVMEGFRTYDFSKHSAEVERNERKMIDLSKHPNIAVGPGIEKLTKRVSVPMIGNNPELS